MIEKIKGLVRSILLSDIFRKTLQVSFLAACVKVVAFLKDVYIVHNFSFGKELDAFFIALVVPQFILGVFTSSINSIVIPNYMREQELNPKGLGSFTYTTMLISVTISLVLSIVCIFNYSAINSLFSYSTNAVEFAELSKIHFFYLIPTVLLSTISSSIGALLNSKNKYLATSLTPLYPIVFTVVGLFFFMNKLGIYALSVGFTIGYVFEMFTMVFLFQRERFPFERVFKITSSIKLLISQALHKISASLFAAFIPIANQIFAVRQVEGSVSMITYAQKVPLFINMILTMSLGVTILPYFAKKVAAEINYNRREYIRLLATLFFSSLLICLVFILFSQTIVHLLFSRGKTNFEYLGIVNQLQKIYFIQIPFYLLAIVAVRLLTALNRNSQSLYASIVSMVLIFTLNYIFEKPFGIMGIALATLCATIFNMIVNVWFSIRNLKNVD